MDAKVTLSFNEEVINKAKEFADEKNISLSRLTEYLYERITNSSYHNLEEMPVASWINQLAEGAAVYLTKKSKRKSLKAEYFKSKK